MALQDTIDQLNNLDLSELDFNRIGVWPLAGRVFVLVVVALLIISGTYFVVVKDKNIQLAAAVAKESELKRNFERKSFEASNLDAYRQQMVEMEKTLGKLVSQLPSDTEVPGLLEDIDEKGSESGLDINSINLQPEKTAEFYVELPIKVDIEGGYHDFGNFVSGIASMSRIVTLHNYTISRSKASEQLSMTIDAKTYRYKSQDE